MIMGTFALIMFMTSSPLFNVGYRKGMLLLIASLFYVSHSITTTLKRGRGVFNWLIYNILFKNIYLFEVPHVFLSLIVSMYVQNYVYLVSGYKFLNTADAKRVVLS